MEDFGLIRRRVLGDGNCLFRAISFVLLGDENSYDDLRATATEYMREHPEQFQDFFHPENAATDPHQYMLQEIDRLSRNGVYAGQESVVALALALGVNIFVTYGGTINDPRVFTMQHHASEPTNLDLHIIFSNFGGGHYDAAVDKNNSDLSEETVPSELYNELTSVNFDWKETSFSSFCNSPATEPKSSTKTNGKQHKFDCDICKKTFSCNSALKRHDIKFHPGKKCAFQPRTNFVRCMVYSCQNTFRTVKDLLLHLTSDHSANIETSTLNFPNLNDFKLWKENEELKNNVFFVKHNEKYSKKGTSFQFVCNRHGQVHSNP